MSRTRRTISIETLRNDLLQAVQQELQQREAARDIHEYEQCGKPIEECPICYDAITNNLRDAQLDARTAYIRAASKDELQHLAHVGATRICVCGKLLDPTCSRRILRCPSCSKKHEQEYQHRAYEQRKQLQVMS